MKHQEQNPNEIDDKAIDRHLGFFKSPPKQEMDRAEERILGRMRIAETPSRGASHHALSQTTQGNGRWARIAMSAAAAAIVLVVLIQVPTIHRAIFGIDVHAVVETADGSLSRVVGDGVQVVRAGERVEAGEVVRSSESAGGVISLADTSRIEMRAGTELWQEVANDGVRIHLNKGSIIVNAAKQRIGHLYVQTKDVTVSVVGTVFLVNAGVEGSRVAVIQGEVHVQQGETLKKLLPGDQVASNPLMESQTVSREIAWSQNAPEHIALLQLSAGPGKIAEKDPSEWFEEASVRPSPPPPAPRNIRGGPPAGGPLSAFSGPLVSIQLDPGRLIINNTTFYGLVSMAYGKRSPTPEELSGGPNWIRSDRFDVQALIPQGSPAYTQAELRQGKAPKLQKMLQNLLADRFKLVMRRDTRDMPVYNLVVVQPEKLKQKLSEDQIGAPKAIPADAMQATLTGARWMGAIGASIPDFIGTILQNQMDRPVIDKTDTKGRYDFWLTFPELLPSPTPNVDVTMRDLIPAKLVEQYGLKLESARALVEVLVIEHVEKPSEN